MADSLVPTQENGVLLRVGNSEMDRTATLFFLTLVFLFVLNLNSLWLHLCFKNPGTQHLHPFPDGSPVCSTSMENLAFNSTHRHSKPWPILPSYLPWSQAAADENSAAPLRSCEAYFGNGFTERIDLLNPNVRSSNFPVSGGGGWFRCWHSETMRSSICEGGKIRMVTQKIHMARGGERLEEVIGRTEDEEMPVFENGAFEIDGGDGITRERQLANAEFLDRYMPKGGILKHTMRELVASTRVVASRDFLCEEVRFS